MQYASAAFEDKCAECGAKLEPECGEDNGYQYENALVITFDGGYGMFIDPFGYLSEAEAKAANTVLLCHECAHAFCEQHTWARFILNPYRSHSHRVAWKEQHPEHDGWDYHEPQPDDTK